MLVLVWRTLFWKYYSAALPGPDGSTLYSTGNSRTAPCLAEMCAILSRLDKLKDLSQIDGVVPVFGLLLTTPLIISQNHPVH